MAYSTDSPLKGSGSASAQSILAWLQSHAQDGANYVHLPVAELPADLGQAIVEECQAAGINGDLVAAQVAHESSYAQSNYARNRNNYAGIGAENANPDNALVFPTPRAGIHAQLAHLRTYVEGADNPWKADDPRYEAARAAGYLASCRVLADLAGRWAWPGTGYAQAIADHANDLLNFAASHGGSTVSVTDFYGVPLAWMPAADGNFDTSRGKVRLFIVHDEEAATAMSAVNRFQTAGQQASAHFVVDPANGTIRQCVSTAHTAYACGNYALNQVSVSTEMPGFMGKPYDPRCVDYQARCAAYCVQKFGLPIVRLTKQQVAAGAAGFCGHEDVPDPDHPGQWGGSDHHGDPGATFPWDQCLSLVRQYAGGSAPGQAGPQVVTPPTPVQPAPQPAATERVDGVTGKKFVLGFKVWRDSMDAKLGADQALALIGRPLTNEFSENGMTVQYCERLKLEYHPENQPPWDIMGAQLGAQSLADAKASHPEQFS